MAVVAPLGAPTRDDAVTAAAALIAAGAEEVLLFGSVARGDAHDGSDIDLVALFADIDYSQRRAIRRRLETVAASATRWATQVIVTDRPEWRRRLEGVSSSFERRISRGAVTVATATDRSEVRWDKEMVLPMSNPTEALRYFNDHVLRKVGELRAATDRSPSEDDPALTPAQHEVMRLDRMIRLCEDSSVAVELALKALAILHGVSIPSERTLKAAGHNIASCLTLVPEPPRSAVREVVRRLGLDLTSMSQWRMKATYPDDLAVERRMADTAVGDYVVAAVTVCGFAVAELRKEVGDAADMRDIEQIWRAHASAIVARDARTGTPVSPPPDSTPEHGHRSAP